MGVRKAKVWLGRWLGRMFGRVFERGASSM